MLAKAHALVIGTTLYQVVCSAVLIVETSLKKTKFRGNMFFLWRSYFKQCFDKYCSKKGDLN